MGPFPLQITGLKSSLTHCRLLIHDEHGLCFTADHPACYYRPRQDRCDSYYPGPALNKVVHRQTTGIITAVDLTVSARQQASEQNTKQKYKTQIRKGVKLFPFQGRHFPLAYSSQQDCCEKYGLTPDPLPFLAPPKTACYSPLNVTIQQVNETEGLRMGYC